jgi:hypothetical protein
MTQISLRPLVVLLAASGIVLAQPQTPVDPQASAPNAGWRKAGDPPPAVAQDPAAQDQSVPVVPQDQPISRDAYGQAQPSSNRPPAAMPPQQSYGIPAQVILRQGTLISMRLNQHLEDSKSSIGDGFSGTLTQPLVVNGIVVAQSGQIVYGRVVEAEKVKSVHRLGIELTGIALVDGTRLPVRSLFLSRQGAPYPYGHDRGAITTTASNPPMGVLQTKGHDSELYPQETLTFQIETNVAINTTASNGAFRYVGPEDYTRAATKTTVATRPAYAYGPAYPYYGWGYPYYWGPSIGFGIGFGGYWGGWRGGWRR